MIHLEIALNTCIL